MPEAANKPLTRLCHERLAGTITSGDIVVDATIGNGHDSLFLAERVGDSGRVYGFDIQPGAIKATRQRLSEAGLMNFELILTSHADMLTSLPANIRGQVTVVMFNLGYLPRGNKRITTRANTTLAALDQAMTLLRSGGMLSVMAYPGHEQGAREARAVHRWMAQHPDHQRFDSHGSGPRLYLLCK